MPFRLTRNLATFFTAFGVEGIFITTLAVAAQARPWAGQRSCGQHLDASHAHTRHSPLHTHHLRNREFVRTLYSKDTAKIRTTYKADKGSSYNTACHTYGHTQRIFTENSTYTLLLYSLCMAAAL